MEIRVKSNLPPTAERHRWKIQRKAVCFQAIVRGLFEHNAEYILFQISTCPLYSTAVLNLYTFTCIFLQVFLSCTLVAPKYTKRPAYVKNSRLLLCSQVASNILQSQQTCHFNPICLEQGVAKLVPHGCIRKITAMLHSNNFTSCKFVCAHCVYKQASTHSLE